MLNFYYICKYWIPLKFLKDLKMENLLEAYGFDLQKVKINEDSTITYNGDIDYLMTVKNIKIKNVYGFLEIFDYLDTELKEFEFLENVYGDLHINDINVENLDFFKNLKNIQGNLTISNCYRLKSISNIEKYLKGNLKILNCKNLIL